MATFTIDSDNNITAHAGLPPSGAHEPFATLKDLTKLTGSWPMTRLAEIWNSFAGVAPFTDLKPVKKFTSRKDAVARIWSAVERLAPLVAEPAPDVAPVKGKRDKNACKQKRRDTPRAAAKQTENVARDGSKAATILELLKRPGGATSKELIKATGCMPGRVLFPDKPGRFIFGDGRAPVDFAHRGLRAHLPSEPELENQQTG